MREAQLETRFRRGVRAAGGVVVKLAPTTRGVPDRLVLMPGGRLTLVELKTTTGRLSAAQTAWHAAAEARGVIVEVLRGADELDAWIERNRP